MRKLNHYRKEKSQEGVALVTTLFVLVLVVTIVIGFFSMVGIAQRSSRFHQDATDLQNLKDTAISIAMAQIREGTTREGTMWASQPGAIRTFSNEDGSRKQIYKLYSDDEMVLDSSELSTPAELSLENDVPPDWNELPDIYVDLNEPVASLSDSDLHFPIVDPRLWDGRDHATSESPEGFSYGDSLAVSKGEVTGVFTPDQGHLNDSRIPMPVRWIYVLKDGSFGTLNDDGEFSPFANENEASATNPMVGRFAFWTDDESSKINVNTASEAIPWDTPKCATPEDIGYADFTPVRNEVQRFGGHPAATCLSSVFFPNQDLDPEDDKEKFRAIYDLVPRVNIGGFIDGKSREAVEFDKDRLYSNIEEALLAPDREVNKLFSSTDPGKLAQYRFLLTANSRAPEVTAAGRPRICLWPVNWHNNATHQTAFDKLIVFNSVLNGRPYLFLRHAANSNIGEYREQAFDGSITGGDVNAQLLRYLMTLGSETEQGYSLSMWDKYTAHDMDTTSICFTEYMRQINLHDNTTAPSGKAVVPYAVGWGNRSWGTELHGQVTNIGHGSLPGFAKSRLNRSQLITNGVGRIYAASEVGLAFALVAEQKVEAEDGSEISPGFNLKLADSLKLLPGEKAIQVAPVFEGFNPAQGYTMSAPASGARIHPTDLSNLQLHTSAGVKQIVNPAYTGEGYNKLGGGRMGIVHSVSYLRGKAFGEDQGDPLYSPATWWVGWGGSGGRWMYAGSNANRNSSHMARERPSQSDLAMKLAGFDSFDQRIPSQYARGYFIIPGEVTEATVSRKGGSTLRFMLGNQRDADFAGHNTYLPVPAGMTIPIPEAPVTARFRSAPTWGERYCSARGEMSKPNNRHSYSFEDPEILDPNDVVRTWVSRHGDHRLQYIRETEKSSLPAKKRLFIPHPGWDPESGAPDKDEKQVHSFTLPGGEWEPGATYESVLVPGVDYPDSVRPDFTVAATNPRFSENVPGTYPYSVDPAETRDWDNGTGIAPDGAYWNKVDDVAHEGDGIYPPYFSKMWDGTKDQALDETSAPNQQVPSAVILGSINSAPATGLQWTTFLFRPELAEEGHLGAGGRSITGDREGAPPDHTILDWFWMPVVQPYALSERFSTAGKINLNYRMAPFSYIKRATGLHAVLKSERMLAIPTSAGPTYKDYASSDSNTGWRHRIDATETLKQFETKFDSGEVFRMESEICEQFLIPRGETVESIRDFWDEHRLTGDATLERPYANIYPRLTTRSNVFRVHIITQTLRKSRDSDPLKIDPQLDTFEAEYRGDALLERAIDPGDSSIPDYISDLDAPSLDQFYRYRILHTRRFAP